MSKMSNLAIEVAELLHNGNSVDEIANRTGMPVAWILDVKRNLIDDSMEYIKCETL